MTRQLKQRAGSQVTGEPAFLEVGKIHRPHGVRGEVMVTVFTDYPERLQEKKSVFAGAKYQALTIRSRRPHMDGLLLAFEGFETPESVGHLRNQVLYIDSKDASPLQEGEYYYFEMQGIQVLDENGTLLGSLVEVLETGANDVYVVRDEAGTELLLPAIPEVVRSMDVKGKKMTVHLLPGLRAED